MVFLFGMDLPLMEIMFVIAVLLISCLIGLIFALFKEVQINKKLDVLLKEEHKIKKELDFAEMEENKQIILLRHIVNEIASLHGIRIKGIAHVDAMKGLAEEARQLPVGATKSDHQEILQRMVQQVAKLDRLSLQETKQLAYINDIVTRMRQR